MVKKIVLSLIFLVVVAVAVVYVARNVLVARAVEAGSTYALGVETNLGSASLELGGGSLELSDLTVHNPEGFTADGFLSLRRGIMTVDVGSVLDNEVKVDSFVIDGITLNLEQIDRAGNFKVILDHIKRMNLSSSEESQTFHIGLIALRDINVTGSLSLMGKRVDRSFQLDNFALRDVGGDNGAKISELTATVVRSLITKALASRGNLPAGFAVNLEGLKQQAEDLKDEAVEQIGTEAAGKLKDLGGSLTGGKN